MKLQEVVDEIKLELTGYVLDMEIEDATIIQIINKSLRELERYWDETTMITVPFSSCIDLSGIDKNGESFYEKVSSIVGVYRTQGVGNVEDSHGILDPLYAQQWMVFSNGGTMYNLNDYMLNYASWVTLSKIKNTISTDMAFKEDRHNEKLYINGYMSNPGKITIEYVPKLKSVEDIKSDYWIDILIRLSVATTKITLGRIRTRFTQSGALWTQDGEKLLEEGTSDLKDLREILRTNSNLVYPID